MVYITGDIHGKVDKIMEFTTKMKLTSADVIVILGDVGANYFCNERDLEMKNFLGAIAPTILCIHGNHEVRPANLESYILKDWNGGKVWYESDYPNLLFAKDGEIYELDGKRCIAIGGAYSVDKYYRLSIGAHWWQDEQPSEEIKSYVEEQLRNNRVDIIFSHTCPMRYEPTDMFISSINQSQVDSSTEQWLDEIENKTEYKAWYCGHWHTDRRVDKIHFLFDGWESLYEEG